MTIQHLRRKRGLALILTAEDCEAYMNINNDDESRRHSQLILAQMNAAIAHYYYTSPPELLADKVDMIYNLLGQYWNPHLKIDIKTALTKMVLEGMVDVYQDATGLQRINILCYGGQQQLLHTLLHGMQPVLWRLLKSRKTFQDVNRTLAALLLIRGKPTSTKNLWNPLDRAIRQIEG